MPKALRDIWFDPHLREGKHVSGYHRVMMVETDL